MQHALPSPAGRWPAAAESSGGRFSLILCHPNRQVLRSNKHWFEGVSLVVISNTLWVGECTPCLTFGMRGMISLSVEVCPVTCAP